MIKNLTILMSVCLILLVSCNPNRIYEEHKDLSPKLTWKIDKIVNFEIPIEDNSIDYNLGIAFRYAYGFPYTQLHLNVLCISPSGKKTMKNYSLDIIDENNNYIGEIAGDICDLLVMVEKSIKFDEVGKYTYQISHGMPKERDPVQLAMEIGIIVEKIPIN